MTLDIVLDALLRVVAMLSFVLTTVLFLIWMERKIIGHIQQRLGPMRTGWHGCLQSPADVLKLLTKEDLMPRNADQWVYRLAPYVVFVPGFLIFVSVPVTNELLVRSMHLGLFYILAVSSLSVVGFIMAGLGSGNNYALIGGLRAGAQLISYEMPLLIAVLGVAMVTRSLNLADIVAAQNAVPLIVLQPIGFFLFLVSGLAEMGRTPFDIPAAESELVGGPVVEYTGMRWGIFFAAEYASLVGVAALIALLYLGGWAWPWLPSFDFLGGWGQRLVGTGWFLLKLYAVMAFTMWVRATLPRLRIDQLMALAWKVFIPLAFVNLILTGAYFVYGWLGFGVTLAVTALAAWAIYVGQRAPAASPAPEGAVGERRLA